MFPQVRPHFRRSSPPNYVEPGQAGSAQSVPLPVLMTRIGAELRHGSALRVQGESESKHVPVQELRASAVVALRRGALLFLQGLLPDVIARPLP